MRGFPFKAEYNQLLTPEYEVLQASSYNCHEGTNDYASFVTYTLGVLAAAYRDFESWIELLTTKGLSKPDRVRKIIKNHLGKITKSEFMAKCPDISQITVQRALADLLKSGEIIKLAVDGTRRMSGMRNNDYSMQLIIFVLHRISSLKISRLSRHREKVEPN